VRRICTAAANSSRDENRFARRSNGSPRRCVRILIVWGLVGEWTSRCACFSDRRGRLHFLAKDDWSDACFMASFSALLIGESRGAGAVGRHLYNAKDASIIAADAPSPLSLAPWTVVSFQFFIRPYCQRLSCSVDSVRRVSRWCCAVVDLIIEWRVVSLSSFYARRSCRLWHQQNAFTAVRFHLSWSTDGWATKSAACLGDSVRTLWRHVFERTHNRTALLADIVCKLENIDVFSTRPHFTSAR